MFVEPSRKKKTSTQKNTTSPQWDEELAFIIQDSDRDSLNVVVKDDDMGFNDKVAPDTGCRSFKACYAWGLKRLSGTMRALCPLRQQNGHMRMPGLLTELQRPWTEWPHSRPLCAVRIRSVRKAAWQSATRLGLE